MKPSSSHKQQGNRRYGSLLGYRQLFFSLIFLCTLTIFAQKDMLGNAFDYSIDTKQVINIGNTPDAVGNNVFVGGQELETQIDLKNGICTKDDKVIDVAGDNFDERKSNCEAIGGKHKKIALTIQKKMPWVVQVMKTLLRFLIIIAVTMVIFNGVMYILAVGNADKASSARNNLLSVALGIVLALSSISLIFLIQSLTNTSNNIESLTFIKDAITQETTE